MPSSPCPPAHTWPQSDTSQHADHSAQGDGADTCHHTTRTADEHPALFLPEVRYVVGACLVDDLHSPSAILAARRSYPEKLAGRYEFPGGKIEPGEEPRQALERELMEELGASIRIGQWMAAPDTPDGAWPLVGDLRMFVWLCLAPGLPLPSCEQMVLCDDSWTSHDHLRWVATSEALSLEWLEADYPIVEYIMTNL